MSKHSASKRSASKHAARGSFPVATAGAVAGVVMIGAGAYAAWTSSTTATTGTYTAATVTASDADHDGTVFTSAISNLLPGDYAYRYRTLTNTGSVTQSFSAAVSGAGVLAGTGGLAITVDSCATAWASGVCSGGSSSVQTLVGVSTSPTISYGSLAAAAAKYLRYTFTLPSGAAQGTFMSTTGTVTVAITGSTAAGSNRT